MAYQELLYAVRDGVATITLNRPAKLNAWTGVMEAELREAMAAAEADAEVRVIVLTGAGRGFCAGADMSLLGSLAAGGSELDSDVNDVEAIKKKLFSGPHRPDARPDFQYSLSYFPAIPKPIIAGINGPAAGLGFVLPLFCDLRVMAEGATLSTTFARRGLIAEYGVAWILPRLIGMSAAFDLLLTARSLPAAEALRLGLVSRVLPADGFSEALFALAAELAALSSPRSTRLMKHQLYEGQFQALGEAMELANDELIKSVMSEDFQEGIAHYLEKRPPRFPGR
jgi:enoyl-CoA hydratase/carnithine racemase